MKKTKGGLSCDQGQALLELISERDEEVIQDFHCIPAGQPGYVMRRYCVPKADSKYVTCRTYECPEGYYPVGIHVEDTESGRQGFGFSCIPV